jgi:membrane protein implicated in regulation of membrane protease activity
MTRTFVLKAWFGGAGLGVGLLGMATEQHWLVWIAIALAGVAFLVRFVERAQRAP